MKWTDDSLSRVDSSVHLIYHDLSDLGSLILSRIISEERTLGLWAGINAWQSPAWQVWPHSSDFNWNYILLINREWGQISDREALMYWPSERNGNTSRPSSEISLQWANGRGQLVIYYMAFSSWTASVSMRSIKTNNLSANNKSCTLEPATQSGDTGQRVSFFHSCLYGHRDVHYCICLGNLTSNSQSLQENSRSESAYYCSHVKD